MAYKKDFKGWHALETRVQGRDFSSTPYFEKREVWFCNLGCNVGHEQDGVGPNFWRPVLIIKKCNANLFIGIPLSSKIKKSEFYFPLGKIGEENASAIMSQVRALSSKRLIKKIGTLNKKTFAELVKAASTCVFGDLS
jgi:mRNA interferase MazF